MTADACIYALGGGRGHGVRASVIADTLRAKGMSCEIWRSSEDFGRGARRGELLVVDTFESGLRDELSESFLQGFRSRVLVGRYSRALNLERVNRRYHQVTFPYCELSQEWTAGELRGLRTPWRLAGVVTRQRRWTAGTGNSVFSVLDPESRLSMEMREKLETLARDCGYSARFLGEFSEPPTLSAKTLVVGAGYNLFYELLENPIDVRFLPVRKRYDDQFRRAGRWGRALHSWPALIRWLGESAPARPNFRRFRGEPEIRGGGAG